MRIRIGTDGPWGSQYFTGPCDDPAPECNTNCLKDYDSLDAFLVAWGAHNIIVDHCSFSWAIDETVNLWGNVNNVTFQWSIFAEGSRTGHIEKDHNFGPFAGGGLADNVSFHHNYLAHNNIRNPQLNSGDIRWINNVNYNMQSHNMMLYQDNNFFEPDVINNYFKEGPSDYGEVKNYVVHLSYLSGSPWARIYIAGNKAVKINNQLVSYFNPSDQWSLVNRRKPSRLKSNFRSM